ncbi:MAG: cell division protein FtsL [Gammaproteobacteria bacterium]
MKISTIFSAALFLAVTGSAVAVAYSKFQTRMFFVQLENLRKQRDNLDIEWGQLRLEQSTWATHGRIEKLAHEQLNMVIPENSEIVVILQ